MVLLQIKNPDRLNFVYRDFDYAMREALFVLVPAFDFDFIHVNGAKSIDKC